jgi:outer membrane protease
MKKKLLISLILAAFLFFAFTSNVLAEKIEHQFDISIVAGDGYTEYKIGDVDTDTLKYGFKSLLEFPLDVEMLNLSYSNNFKIPYLNIGGMSIKLEKNLSDDAGTFKDSDWFSTTGMNNKDVIGTSPTEVKDITRWNFKLRNDWLRASENLEYTLHLGYKQDNYDLLSYNLEQTYLTDAFDEPAGTTIKAPGPNISYQAKYDIPYIGLDLKTKNNRKFNLIFSVAYSER